MDSPNTGSADLANIEGWDGWIMDGLMDEMFTAQHYQKQSTHVVDSSTVDAKKGIENSAF